MEDYEGSAIIALLPTSPFCPTGEVWKKQSGYISDKSDIVLERENMDPLWILIVVLIVLAIVYFAKRI